MSLRKRLRGSRWICPILLVFIVCSCGGPERYWPTEKFDTHSWKSSSESERHRFVKDIVASKVLIGKTKAQVTDLLGPSSPSEPSSSLLHYVVKVGGYGFDQVFTLAVRFEGQIVEEVFIRGD
jgi:hypothetical protein